MPNCKRAVTTNVTATATFADLIKTKKSPTGNGVPSPEQEENVANSIKIHSENDKKSREKTEKPTTSQWETYDEEAQSILNITTDIDDDSEKLEVRVMKDQIIPPQSFKLIKCKIPKYAGHEYGIVNLKEGALTAKKLFCPDLAIDIQQFVRIRIRNNKLVPVKLFKNYETAEVYPIEIKYEEEKDSSEENTAEVNSLNDTKDATSAEKTEKDENQHASNEKERLQELSINRALSKEQELQLKNLILKYQDIFIWKDCKFNAGEALVPPQKIHLKDFTPVHKPPFRTGKQQRIIIKQYIDEMLRAKIIRPSTSEYASPLIKSGRCLIMPKWSQIHKLF
ncbi:hypothetical protein BC332_34810 [Capsicum chinense]|nr:hypothetical protein BC332_34810 [Capsicum chinense]